MAHDTTHHHDEDVTISDFKFLVTEHVAPYTRKTQIEKRCNLMRWARWAAQQGIKLLAPTRAQLDTYRATLIEHYSTGYSVNAHIFPLKRFYLWLEDQGIIDNSPAVYLKQAPRPRSSSRAWLTLPQLAVFLQHADDSADEATRGWIYLMACTGMRPGEARTACIEWVREHDGEMVIRMPRRKGGSGSAVVVAEPAASAVRAAIGDRTSGPIFINPGTNAALRERPANKKFKTILADAGLPEITPAGLRTGWITSGRAIGIPIDEQMVGAGHSNLSQTMYYNRGAAELVGLAARAFSAALLEVKTHQLAA